MKRIKKLALPITGVVISTIFQYAILMVMKNKTIGLQTATIFLSDTLIVVAIKALTLKSPNKHEKAIC